MTLRAHRRGRVLAHLDDLGGMDDVQQMADTGQVTLLLQRAADVNFASDELDLIAPLARSAHRSGDWSQRRVIATHGIQRDSDHTAKALFTNG